MDDMTGYDRAVIDTTAADTSHARTNWLLVGIGVFLVFTAIYYAVLGIRYGLELWQP